jgi:hypothetical protein
MLMYLDYHFDGCYICNLFREYAEAKNVYNSAETRIYFNHSAMLDINEIRFIRMPILTSIKWKSSKEHKYVNLQYIDRHFKRYMSMGLILKTK